MSDKILIVDDEPSNRNILEQELTHKGYSIATAGDGREALKEIESARPDLIILDYMMPWPERLGSPEGTSQKGERYSRRDDNSVRDGRAGGRGDERGSLRFHYQAL
jgi:CheY-like chemotaxis protein